MAPADENECRQMLSSGYQLNQPAAVRYPRGKGPGVTIESNMREIPIGKAEVKRIGSGIALLNFGSLLDRALDVGNELNATVINMRFVKPLDTELLNSLVESYSLLVTIEDNVIAGGAGSGVNEYFNQAGLTIPLLNLGLPDEFLDHGTRDEILAEAGLDCDGIKHAVQNALDKQLVAAQPATKEKVDTIIDMVAKKRTPATIN